MDDKVVPYSWEYQCDSGNCPRVYELNGTVYIEDSQQPSNWVAFPVDEWVAYIAHVRATP